MWERRATTSAGLSLAERFTATPAWTGGVLAHTSMRSACWAGTLDGGLPGHAAIDSKVADALTYAWLARDALGLPQELAGRIATEIDTCARSAHRRFPAMVGNQVNWNAELYASAATVTGRGDLLRGA